MTRLEALQAGWEVIEQPQHMINTILVEAIDELLKQGPFRPDCGICLNIERPLTDAINRHYKPDVVGLAPVVRAKWKVEQKQRLLRECIRLMKKTWKTWPLYSGYTLYPIPSNESSLTAVEDYDYNEKKWVGRRGELRYELLQYIKKELTDS